MHLLALVTALGLTLQSVLQLEAQVLVLLVLLFLLVQHLVKLTEIPIVQKRNLLAVKVVELLAHKRRPKHLLASPLKLNQSLASKDVTPKAIKAVAELRLAASPSPLQNPSVR